MARPWSVHCWTCALALFGHLAAVAPALADCQPDGTAGDDTITCTDSPSQDTDGVDGKEGDDEITLVVGATVTGGTIAGDHLLNTTSPGVSPAAGMDTIHVDGTMTGDVLGDQVESQFSSGVSVATGAADTIDVGGEVTGAVAGDGARALPDGGGIPSNAALATGAGDTITIGGIVDGSLSGDDVTALSFFNTSVGVGGDDTMTVTSTGHVAGGLEGDTLSVTAILVAAAAVGGADVIVVDGVVDGSVAGDGATASLSGFFSCSGLSSATGGDDAITIRGVVGGDVVGDGLEAFDCGTGSTSTLTNGNDTVVVAGEVDGTVYGDSDDGSGTGGDDQVTVEDGATGAGPGGTLLLDGGPGVDGLTFRFPFATPADFASFQAELATKHPASDSISWNGQTFSWVNFESLAAESSAPTEVPTLSGSGMALLVLLLALAGGALAKRS